VVSLYTAFRVSAYKQTEYSDPPPTVRLATPKTAQPTAKSKGYAFLEFTDKKGLQAALRLHHSELDGRKINVELTAGGGGKSEHRLKKVKERNKGLHEQRVCFIQGIMSQN
jgi:nucleolar protein 6